MTSVPPADALARRLASGGLGTALIGLAGWIALRNLRLPSDGGWVFWVAVALWLVTMGLLCWWAALSGHHPTTRARIRASWRTGWRLAAIGFAVGFVGPLLITPDGNLGPLLGLLVTGPGGFVLGALGAALAWKNPGSP